MEKRIYDVLDLSQLDKARAFGLDDNGLGRVQQGFSIIATALDGSLPGFRFEGFNGDLFLFSYLDVDEIIALGIAHDRLAEFNTEIHDKAGNKESFSELFDDLIETDKGFNDSTAIELIADIGGFSNVHGLNEYNVGDFISLAAKLYMMAY